MACSKYDELICPGDEEWIGRDEKRVDLLLCDGGERRVDFAACAGVQDMDRALKCLSRLLHIFQLERTSGKVWIYEHADHGSSGDQLLEQPKALSLELSGQVAHAGDVAARSVHAGDKADLDRVDPAMEHNRYRRGC